MKAAQLKVVKYEECANVLCGEEPANVNPFLGGQPRKLAVGAWGVGSTVLESPYKLFFLNFF
jgi:hypothetical protein